MGLKEILSLVCVYDTDITPDDFYNNSLNGVMCGYCALRLGTVFAYLNKLYTIRRHSHTYAYMLGMHTCKYNTLQIFVFGGVDYYIGFLLHIVRIHKHIDVFSFILEHFHVHCFVFCFNQSFS